MGSFGRKPRRGRVLLWVTVVALLIAAVDQTVGGVLVFGDRGTGKSTAIRALAALMPKMSVVSNCPYNCDPAADKPGLCAQCADKTTPGKTRQVPMPVVDLPLGATEDRVIGALDLERALTQGEKAFEPGLLAKAHRGFLYIDEVNLLEDHLVDALLEAGIDVHCLRDLTRGGLASALVEIADNQAGVAAVLGEQVIGYYDPEPGRLVVRDSIMVALAGEPSSEQTQEASLVLVHELVHALQDQRLGLGDSYEQARTADADNAFRAVVEGDLQSGEPVGSRTLSLTLRESVSAATVRNVMQDLEYLGLLDSPHVSAGRVPTQLGLRMFIDSLLEVGDRARALSGRRRNRRRDQ